MSEPVPLRLPASAPALRPAPQEQPEEYLSIRALSQRIPYAEQTVRNLMSSGVLKRGVHYTKPRGRIIFKWSAIRAWLNGSI